MLAVQLIRLREETQSIASEIAELETHARQIPENPEDMVELAEYMDTADDKVEELTVKLKSVTKILSELMMHVQVNSTFLYKKFYQNLKNNKIFLANLSQNFEKGWNIIFKMHLGM